MRWLVLLIALVACSSKREDRVGAPVIEISVRYPGASSEIVERELAMPIERAVATIAKSIETRCESDRLTMQIEVADLDAAAHEVRHALSVVQPELPPDVEVPLVTKTRKDDQPILWLSVKGDLPITEVSRFAQELALDLQRTKGVGQVEEHGLAERQILVRPDLERLRAANLTLFDVLAALQSSEVGNIETLGEVALRDSIRVRDVALIEEGFERAPGAGPPMLAVRAQVVAPRSTVLADVRARIKTLDLPPGVTVTEVPPPSPPRARAPIVATAVGPDLAVLRTFATDVTAELAKAGITDVVRDPPDGGVFESVQIDRERALALGVQMPDVAATLRALTSTRVGRIDRTPIMLKLAAQKLPLDQVYVRGTAGNMIPLSSIITTKQEEAIVILRHDRERAIALAIYAPESLVGAARKIVKARALPAGHRLLLRD